MTYPYDGPEYRAKIGEGCTLPDIPDIGYGEEIALYIWNLKQVTDLRIGEILYILGLKLTRPEMIELVNTIAEIPKVMVRRQQEAVKNPAINNPHYVQSENAYQ